MEYEIVWTCLTNPAPTIPRWVVEVGQALGRKVTWCDRVLLFLSHALLRRHPSQQGVVFPDDFDGEFIFLHTSEEGWKEMLVDARKFFPGAFLVVLTKKWRRYDNAWAQLNGADAYVEWEKVRVQDILRGLYDDYLCQKEGCDE